MVHEVVKIFNCDLLYHIQIIDQDMGSLSNVKAIKINFLLTYACM
jgi:hypothetical protein